MLCWQALQTSEILVAHELEHILSAIEHGLRFESQVPNRSQLSRVRPWPMRKGVQCRFSNQPDLVFGDQIHHSVRCGVISYLPSGMHQFSIYHTENSPRTMRRLNA